MRKPASQGSKLAGKGACLNVSNRRLQVKMTQEAKIVPGSSFIRVIFAFAGFVSALPPLGAGQFVEKNSKTAFLRCVA